MPTTKNQPKDLAVTPSGANAVSRPVNLYWVTTDDHDEDWFVFARTRHSASRFHALYEGYYPSHSRARAIRSNIQLPECDLKLVPCHAQVKDLQALGFKVKQSSKSRRAVELYGEVFMEGTMAPLVSKVRDNTTKDGIFVPTTAPSHQGIAAGRVNWLK